MDIAKVLKDRRIELKISQDELARYLGFEHRATVSRLEAGKIEWKFNKVVKAATLLQLIIQVNKDDPPF